MIDYRIKTFLTLCEIMNYRITAEKLNMTQPAVTQHIHFLEKYYNCKLFIYNGKKLIKTEEAKIIESYCRTMFYNEEKLFKKITKKNSIQMRMGATKTIGQFVIGKHISNYVSTDKLDFSLNIDNTFHLLEGIDHNELDFALIEGHFDKNRYGSKLFKQENFVGLCSKKHRFYNKEIDIEELKNENIILREKGSGTRAIFEQVLYENNFSLDIFKKEICMSSFDIIKELVIKNIGVSFAYEAVATSSEEIGVFYLKDNLIKREFNFVYLNDTDAIKLIELFIELYNL